MTQNTTVKFFLSFIVLLFVFWTPNLSYGAWAPWSSIEGWIGLDYRLQSKSMKTGEWAFTIQFRNRYSQQINFNVNVLNGRGNNRIAVKAEGKFKAKGYRTDNNYIMFTIDKVIFGGDNAFGKYASPDQY